MPGELVAVGPQDWAAWRGLRLEALHPAIGSVRTFAGSVQLGEQDWRAWLGRPGGFWLVRGAGGPNPVAMADTWEEEGRAWLGAVYVQPPVRGGDLLDRLVEAAAEWARAHGHDGLALEVHEDNGRVQAAYRRRGSVETGARRPYPLDPGRDELEMVCPL